MRSHTLFALVFLTVVGIAVAQTQGQRIVVKDAKNGPAYAIVFPKPQYPSELRARHIQGKGIFVLRIRRDGTVSSVQTLTTTGHIELDNAAKNAFINWRFEPGPTEVKMPIVFSLP